MTAFRENLVPAAFLALWVGVSGYTLHALQGLRAARTVEATIELTVTAPHRSAPRASCASREVPLTERI
jgi:hypothetical protein